MLPGPRASSGPPPPAVPGIVWADSLPPSTVPNRMPLALPSTASRGRPSSPIRRPTPVLIAADPDAIRDGAAGDALVERAVGLLVGHDRVDRRAVDAQGLEVVLGRADPLRRAPGAVGKRAGPDVDADVGEAIGAAALLARCDAGEGEGQGRAGEGELGTLVEAAGRGLEGRHGPVDAVLRRRVADLLAAARRSSRRDGSCRCRRSCRRDRCSPSGP